MLTMFSSFSRAWPAPILASLLAASVAIGAPADGTVLRYKYTPEPLTYRYVIKSENESTTMGSVGGDKAMKGGMQQAGLCVFKAKSTSGDTSEVEVVYAAMKMRVDNPMGKPLFIDTTAPAPTDAPKDTGKAGPMGDLEGMMSRMFSSVLGKSINVTVDTRGQVTKVQKTDMFSSMFKEAEALSPAAAEPIKQMFSDDNMKEMFTELYVAECHSDKQYRLVFQAEGLPASSRGSPRFEAHPRKTTMVPAL